MQLCYIVSSYTVGKQHPPLETCGETYLRGYYPFRVVDSFDFKRGIGRGATRSRSVCRDPPFVRETP